MSGGKKFGIVLIVFLVIFGIGYYCYKKGQRQAEAQRLDFNNVLSRQMSSNVTNSI